MDIDIFIAQSNRAKTLDTLVRIFRQALNAYGYSKYICFTPEGPQPDSELQIDGKAHYHQDLIRQYDKSLLFRMDPIYLLLLSVRMPFTWDQVWRLPLSPQQKVSMQLRQDNGLIKGMSIPIRSNDHSLIGISLASEQLGPRTDANAVSELYALAMQFCLRRSELRQDILLTLKPQNDYTTPEAQFRPATLQLAQ